MSKRGNQENAGKGQEKQEDIQKDVPCEKGSWEEKPEGGNDYSLTYIKENGNQGRQ